VATNNVHYARPADHWVANAVAALRARRTLDDMEGWLSAAPTAHLRSGAEMAARFTHFPGAVARSVEIAERCAFEFDTVKPELPDYPVPDGHTEASYLRELVGQGARERYGPPGTNPGADAQLERELAVIEERGFPGYFLIVHSITEFCHQERILCQGRGSATNSAVCYALRITNVDAVKHKLVFERFLSPVRDGYPDIDVDIEAGQREEVIQYVYDQYGRDRAAQVANVIGYRDRLALRDAARVLGYPQGTCDAWSRRLGPHDPLPKPQSPDQQDAEIPDQVLELAARLRGLPRHLGIHSGGMVIVDRPISQVVPTEWASMPGRSVLQWDKDDCADAKLVKFDLLGLGMLGALHDAFDLVREHHGAEISLQKIPEDRPEVYDMLCDADSVGVFQVESRAQMATLPRLRPRTFYDLVVEVAIIRPGPIQGGAVHPYLYRRDHPEAAKPPHPILEDVLKRTLGVPLFQEQVMQMAIAAAGFSAVDADRLRRAMSAKRSIERMEELRERLMKGMAERDIPDGIAEDIYGKLQAFANFGFPESHSISMAYLVWCSAYLKRYYPAAFTTALLRNQPMGFYSPASLIADARRHDVTIRRADVNASAAKAALEPLADDETYTPTHRHASSFPQPAIRLGLAAIRHVGSSAELIVAERAEHGPYSDLEDFVRRTDLPARALEALAAAGAFASLGHSRRRALWIVGALAGTRGDQLPGTAPGTHAPELPPMTGVEQTFADLWTTGVTPDDHPISHLRPYLDAAGITAAARLSSPATRRLVRVAGLVTHRQRPPTAGGVCFLSLEDETGLANVICPPAVWERHKRVALDNAALVVQGNLERANGVTNVVAVRLRPLRLAIPHPHRSRDFR
jgi:error-prone DNA polymerase